MAQAVEQALEEKRHLIVEAGTGTGKTLAYLLPVIRSGKRVIISTGTKNLQEQLFLQRCPLPRASAIPERRRQAERLLHEGAQQLSLPEEALRPYRPARAQRTRGNRALPRHRCLGEDHRRPAIAPNSPRFPKPAPSGTSSMRAPIPAWDRSAAPWDRCFITEMHRKAMESDIIIVNHHLFFADLASSSRPRMRPMPGSCPTCGAVIFDEAHELEDVAGSYFGISVSNRSIRRAVPRCRSLAAAQPHALGLGSRARLKSLRERAQFFFSLLPPGEGRFAFENRREFLEENGDEFLGLQQALHRVWRSELENLPHKPEEIFNFAPPRAGVAGATGFLMESEDRNTVFWIERRRGGREQARMSSCRPRRSMWPRF